MKVISIKQPWAWLICAEIKPIENRTWSTKFRGRILIHSGQSHESLNALNENQRHYLNSKLCGEKYPYPGIKNYSSIIGSVEIVDCVLNHKSIWAEHKATVQRKIKGENVLVEVPVYNWVLANPVLFDEPIENVKGKLSFWDYESEDFHECTSCDKKFPMEIMESDSGGNWFCPECWEVLAPVMQAEYEELKEKGEID